VITEDDLFNPDEHANREKGVALVWVIDGDCLYDIPLSKEYYDMFVNHDEVVDVTEEYSIDDGLVVRFVKNDQTLHDLKTSEYFGSILLSNPTVLDLSLYPYGHHVVSPYAKFDGEKFIILNQDAASVFPWSVE